MLTAQERSGRAPTTGAVSLTVPCGFQTHGPMKWSFVSCSSCEVVFSQREGWCPSLLCVSVDPADSTSVIKGRFWAEEPGGWPFAFFFWFISTKTVLSVRISSSMDGFILLKHRSCRRLDLMTFETCGGLFTEEPTNHNKRLASSTLNIQ